ncbi:xanthine dehydrogenase family protein molybdopterin-binding subunit [Methylobacterium nonmethylotrophicum]|uniref:Xanthine dehydrogenase family protein molybdopterin-binding subunit n=1 Tax=Methylobacterium nonmethylotrophicum TaxID=1141884 RepID=A0A4Z0NSB9_9HYPH|nr:xanthine dehydrogenase family protein molybdopterin-binding subunit [Methylobacterium nonmethylotrophicum]TGE00153.1 xanthine dehydrogenase family protein molybdopterin-binding subunit [Methylobacterium nonmethylotrophicum]
MTVTKFGLGQPLRRVEDRRLITGEGHYGDDHAPEGCLHAALLRSPHAHAKFTVTDLEAARAMPGVHLVLTAEDVAGLGDIKCQAPLPNSDGSQNHVANIPLLAKGVAKHIGDAVAFVVADTLAQARDAVEAIGIDYEVLPAVVGIRGAISGGGTAVWDQQPDNVSFDATMGDRAPVDAAFAKAAKVVRVEVENQRLVTNYMETRSVVAEYDAGTKRFTLTIPSQGVHGLRKTLTGVLGVGKDQIRVVTGDVGGGFGTKTFTYREYPLAAEAARRLGKPVKWVSERAEHFVACTQGRDNLSVGEVALDQDGTFLAMRFDVIGDLGAYLSQYGPYIPYLGATMLTGVYKTPAVFVRVRGVYTNTVPVDAYRGAGRPEAAYLIERLVDRAARETGMSPAEIRRRNFIPPSAMPYTTPIGDRTYDTGDFAGHMGRAIEAADWDGFAARVEESRRNGLVRGIGLATYIECTAWGEGEDVKVTLDKDGGATVYVGTQSNGQGHATAYAQFAAEHLDLPLERIRMVQGDTDKVATGAGTGGSRSIPVGGISVGAASKNLAGKLKELASEELEAGIGDLEIAEGAVRVAGTDRSIDFAALASLPKATEAMLTGQGDFVPPSATYPNGTHVAEVEIDPETGITEIVRYTVCDDFGIVVNPLLLAGQVHGGVVQGIGQALHERTVYDADGQLLTASFMDYAMPRAGDVPFFHFETRNVPSTTNPMGIKGAGEAGSIGSCPAVMNAVVDALDRSVGLRDIDMPATPARMFAALAPLRKAAAA